MPYFMVFFVFNSLRREVFFCFVDIGEIVDHFLFIIYILHVLHQYDQSLKAILRLISFFLHVKCIPLSSFGLYGSEWTYIVLTLSFVQ